MNIRALILASGSSLLMLLTACSMAKSVGQSLSFENRLFVRVPGKPPKQHLQSYASIDGWHFKHMVAGPWRNENQPEAQWYMVWNDDPNKVTLKGTSPFKLLFTGTPLRHSDWDRTAEASPSIARAVFHTFHVYPQMIQPELIYKTQKAKEDAERSARERAKRERNLAKHRDDPTYQQTGDEIEVGHLPEGIWASVKGTDGKFDPLWHMGPSYSQLQQARERVRAIPGNPSKDIRIGILDTGFDEDSKILPAHLTNDVVGDALSTLACTDKECIISRPGDARIYHGLGTMSILASGKHRLVDKWSPGFTRKLREDQKAVNEGDIEFGGTPDSHIVAARVAPFVLSLSTANLAYAIDYASRHEKCDVLSMSHGGAPTAMWIDAVNAAYDRGTAIYAATADYYNFPMIDLGIVAPSATVYPAACRRVMGVAGVTAEGNPYGSTEWSHYLRHMLNPLNLINPGNWFTMRGSYGADGVHRSVWTTLARIDENKLTDKPQKRYGGLLRANPISAYTPAVAWAELPSKAGGRTNIVRLNGGGTSAATPQAAAAGALWLAYHKKEIDAAIASGKIEPWEKVEAAYIAMLNSAQPAPRNRSQLNVAPADRMPEKYTGAGCLKANDMLNISLDEARATSGKNLKYPRLGSPRDFYDAARSGAAILGWTLPNAPISQRSDAIIGKGSVLTKEDDIKTALQNVYFNQLLAQQWNIGRLPLKDTCGSNDTPLKKGWLRHFFSPDGADLKKTAEKMAEKSAPK